MRIPGHAFALLSALCVASCSAALRAPGGSTVPPAVPADSAPRGAPVRAARYTAADVRFMQGMIGHHAQALELTELVRPRASRDDIRLLAQRVAISQDDEIRLMQRWLQRRSESVPAAQSHTGHAGAARMPGMATPAEVAQLTAATGVEFDRLFLDLMIRHHEGALTMVAELFAAGGGREAEIFQFASHVDADQRAEIARMRRMQTAPPQRGTTP